MLKIIVTVKQVPDTHNISGKAMKDDGTVNRAALPTIFNPEDLNALEEALKIKERWGAHITAITMGPPKAADILKECLYRGVDNAVLISDMKFAGADTLATSYALKCTVEKLGHFDLILCGRQAIDGDTAQVGPQLAEKLSVNQITCVNHVDDLKEAERTITARRETEYGEEVVRAKLPVLLTITQSANEPRFPSAKKVMAYKNIVRKRNDENYEMAYLEPEHKGRQASERFITEWNVESIGADPIQCGLSGSPTKVKKIDNVVLTASEMKQIQNSDAGIQSLMKELIQEHILG